MACEVLQMKYAFRSKADTWPPQMLTEVMVPFRMNFLHDLESVFWSFAWVLYRHTDTDNQTSNPDGRLREFRNLFPGSFGQRLLFLRYDVLQARHILADDFGETAWCLAHIAYWLVDGFTAVEKSYPQIIVKDDCVIKHTHEGIQLAFSEALQSTRSDIRLISVSEISKKRNLGEDERSSPTQKKMRPA